MHYSKEFHCSVLAASQHELERIGPTLKKLREEISCSIAGMEIHFGPLRGGNERVLQVISHSAQSGNLLYSKEYDMHNPTVNILDSFIASYEFLAMFPIVVCEISIGWIFIADERKKSLSEDDFRRIKLARTKAENLFFAPSG